MADYTPETMRQRWIQRQEMIPCKSAFIDTHTPGSHLKENFSIIGPGVTESAEQVVHLREHHGFNIGAAGQPPRIKNSLHSHFTAEVFMIHSGTWDLYWGLHGEHHATLEPGDVISIPVHCFRGFENIGDEYGFLFAVLGGDDTGGVEWAPQVFEAAEDHGLVLLEERGVWDTRKAPLPEDAVRVTPMSWEQARSYDNYTVEEMEARICRSERLFPVQGDPLQEHEFGPIQLHRLIAPQQAAIPGGEGFTLLLSQASPGGGRGAYQRPEKEVLICNRGRWDVAWEHRGLRGAFELGPGDVFSVPPGCSRRLECVGSEAGQLYSVIAGDAPTPPIWID